MSWAFIICTVIWVCEASKVNNLTVLAVGPNHRDSKDKIASSGSDPPKGSDKKYAQIKLYSYKKLLKSAEL